MKIEAIKNLIKLIFLVLFDVNLNFMVGEHIYNRNGYILMLKKDNVVLLFNENKFFFSSLFIVWCVDVCTCSLAQAYMWEQNWDLCTKADVFSGGEWCAQQCLEKDAHCAHCNWCMC